MEVNQNKIVVYNTPHLRSENPFAGIRCWVPKSQDAEVVITYLQKNKNRELYVEDTLIEYTDKLEERFVVRLKPSKVTNKKVVLYAQSDTLADSCSKVYYELKKQGKEVLLLVPASSPEKADEFYRNEGLPFSYFSVKLLKSFSPDIFMVLNDWTKEVHRIFSYCKQLKIPTVCLQESIINFGDHMKRMLFADHVLVQGVQTLNELHRTDYYITGNPRYLSDKNNNPGEKVLINCNFTYGVFENERDNWLSDIQHVLTENSVAYQISQHPRDTGKIDGYGTIVKTNSQTLPSIIKTARFVITRFSSIVHEALAQNVPVIYYNPHNEQMKYDFGFNDTFLRYATNKQELNELVDHFKSYVPDKELIASYLSVHCIPKDGSAAENITFLLSSNQFNSSPFTYKDFVYRILYYPIILNTIKRIKRFCFQK